MVVKRITRMGLPVLRKNRPPARDRDLGSERYEASL
jgi:hypothetical protein